MPRYSQKLHELPAAIAASQFTPADDPSSDELCFVCHRNFGEYDDPYGLPCHPCKILACGNLISSECLFRYVHVDYAKLCPFCRTPIEAGSVFLFWVTWIASTNWFTKYLDVVTSRYPYTIGFDTYEQMVQRRLHLKTAWDIWPKLYVVLAPHHRERHHVLGATITIQRESLPGARAFANFCRH
jgi:hypothetical protein